MAKVEKVTVETIPLDGAQACDYGVLANVPSFSPGALVCDISYTSDCGTNIVKWTLKMKNGDVLTLQKELIVERLILLDYYPEDVPMNNAEELQELIDQITVEADPHAVVNLHLPAVTYEGDFVISERTICLIGSESDGHVTTIKGNMRIETRKPYLMELRNIVFEGEGGTGLTATEGLVVNDCTFRGYDIGAEVLDGGWIALTNGKFEKNKIGLHLNSSDSTLRDPYFTGCQFLKNEVGLFVEEIPSNMELYFQECFFMENEKDIENPSERVLDLSDSDFR